MLLNRKTQNISIDISFCTVSMNRLHHIVKTLEKNIIDNLQKDFLIEFILLDYDSDDGLFNWVKKNFSAYLGSGLLKLYRFTGSSGFDRSHSRNLAFRLSNGKVICNVDADNLLGRNFHHYLYDTFSGRENVFLTPLKGFCSKDVFGRVALFRQDFYNIEGYNEGMKGWGYEDEDLYNRLLISGCSRENIEGEDFLHSIDHDDLSRIKNEEFGSNVLYVYLNYLTPWMTEVLYLLKNNLFINGILQQDEIVNSIKKIEYEDYCLNSKINGQIKSITSLKANWKKGSWSLDNESILLKFQDTEFNNLYKVDKDNNIVNHNTIFYLVLDESLKHRLILIKSDIDNRRIMEETLNQNIYKINNGNFGVGQVRNHLNECITIS